jgi:hypothetical protein
MEYDGQMSLGEFKLLPEDKFKKGRFAARNGDAEEL